jgi:hypothetical protein
VFPVEVRQEISLAVANLTILVNLNLSQSDLKQVNVIVFDIRGVLNPLKSVLTV